MIREYQFGIVKFVRRKYMDIITEFLNDIYLWNKAILSLSLDGIDFWYRMVTLRYESLRQSQGKDKSRRIE